MGVVYRARGPSGGDVAIKLMLEKAAGEALQRFDRERRLLSELGEDAGFVPLLDAGAAREGPFIVMPFLAGGSLRARLDDQPLPVAEAIELAKTLAHALGRAHAKGIVHRDLKPENV